MKKRQRLASVCAAALLALLMQPARAAAGADDPALRETLKQLGSVLTRHGSKVVGGTVTTFDVRDFRGCQITYELTPKREPGRRDFVGSIERVTLDLSTLDPALITVKEGQGGRASVSFATRGKEPGIELSVATNPHHFGPASRLNSYYIGLRSKAAAEEARGLLVRAVGQCQEDARRSAE